MDERFCAICEQGLGEKDSEHVCRSCFRKAREPKEVTVEITDRGAERMGIALALGNLFNWGLDKLVEFVKLPPPPTTAQQTHDEALAVRKKLEEMRRRLEEGDPDSPGK